jgi:hypothetical protein
LLLFHFAYNKFWLYSYAFLIFCPRAKSFHRTSMNSSFFSVCTSDGKIPSVCGGKKKKVWFRFSFFFYVSGVAPSRFRGHFRSGSLASCVE